MCGQLLQAAIDDQWKAVVSPLLLAELDDRHRDFQICALEDKGRTESGAVVGSYDTSHRDDAGDGGSLCTFAGQLTGAFLGFEAPRTTFALRWAKNQDGVHDHG